mmetsp:Transcript_70447/g.147482  ORF Transcript_70447/g.147482 Transcript_70447/m.147482 type:complete len:253 (-) Transcript_70447:399-1157(-)
MQALASAVLHGSEESLVRLTVLDDGLQLVPSGRLGLGACGVGVLPVRSVERDVARVVGTHLRIRQLSSHEGIRRLEVADGLGLDFQVAEGGDMALRGALGDALDLCLDGLGGKLASIRVLHPGDGEEIAQAAAHVLALHDVVGRAVEAPGRLLGVGGGDSEDLAVLGEVGEHGARLARLHVEGQFLEHFLGLHRLKSLGQVRGVHVRPVWEGDDADAAVVDEVEEDPVVLSALQDLAGATFGQVAVVAGDHL